MPLIATDAVILHAQDYLESSRIYRLATRDAGVQSVLARGARRARSKVGPGADLFSGGIAHIYLKPGRDLNTLAGFDLVRARHELAAGLDRFTGASALAELVLRFVRDDSNPGIYDALVEGLDALTSAEIGTAPSIVLGAAWRLVSELGFTPAVDACCVCHAALPHGEAILFSHPAGGALCASCARSARSNRRLPAGARAAIQQWLSRSPAESLADADVRSHQRLLREFVSEHLSDGKPLRAFDVWEQAAWESAG